jgi:hypothetical protein
MIRRIIDVESGWLYLCSLPPAPIPNPPFRDFWTGILHDPRARNPGKGENPHARLRGQAEV